MAKKRQKILVVDDLPDWRTTLSGLLSDAGYEVQVTDSFTKALELFQKNQFDAAVLDIRLVDSDEENEEGLKLATEIKKHWSDVKVILITGYGTDERTKRALEPNAKTGIKPADDYLPKADTDKLVPTVQRVLAAKR